MPNVELEGPRALDELLRSGELVDRTSVLVEAAPLVVWWEEPAAAPTPAAVECLRTAPTVTVLVGRPGAVPAGAVAAFDMCLTPDADPPAPWVSADVEAVVRTVAHQPLAALTLVAQLRGRRGLDVWTGVVTESAAYAALLGSAGFRAWREGHRRRPPSPGTGPAVLVERAGDHLTIILNRPDRHNALDMDMRDNLVAALHLATIDPGIASVELRGAGSSFSSGGDLDEFGTVGDPATAHAVRLTRHPGWSVHLCRDKVTAHLHGACIGAGAEIPAFAGRVTASPDTVFALPEVGMGLIPGAGGTVSITRRVGPQRCAWLALTGAPIDATTAHRWGMVDELSEP